MPRPTQPDPDPGHVAAVRRAAARAIEQVHRSEAPADVIDAVAWAKGAGAVNTTQAAVMRARAAGYTWKQIAVALDENPETAKTKYDPANYERQRQRRARKKTAEES